MSYFDNTPFSLVTVDAKTGENLSPEAIENRKRLVCLWKINNEKQKSLAEDINDPATHCEEALTGDEYIELLRNLVECADRSKLFPILKMEKLEELAAINLSDSANSPLN